MPHYNYKCKKCGFEFTKFQSISEKDLKTCPECGGDVSKLLSGGAGVIYKGEGFYVNDYNPSKKKEAKKDTPSACNNGGCGSCCQS